MCRTVEVKRCSLRKLYEFRASIGIPRADIHCRSLCTPTLCLVTTVPILSPNRYGRRTPECTVDQRVLSTNIHTVARFPWSQSCQYSTWNQEYIGSIETAGLAGGPSCGFGKGQHGLEYDRSEGLRRHGSPERQRQLLFGAIIPA